MFLQKNHAEGGKREPDRLLAEALESRTERSQRNNQILEPGIQFMGGSKQPPLSLHAISPGLKAQLTPENLNPRISDLRHKTLIGPRSEDTRINRLYLKN